MFRIGEFSKLSKTTITTLRYYDEIGLLKPEATDPFTNYRLYTSAQLVELHRIQALRQIGLSLEDVRQILSGQDQRPILQHRKTELLSNLAEAQSQLSRIEFILQGEPSMNYSATIKDLPSCTVYSKKINIPTYDASRYHAYFNLIPEIGATIAAKYPDLKCATPEYCFISYPDGEYTEETVIHIEFCEAVDKPYPDFDDITFKQIPACTVVSVMHKGPYTDLPKAYAFACKWIEENGYTIADSPRENYIDGIWNQESEANWLTELQIPITKA
ncbi:MAG: MerR family transcriptional regulator [Oscillospiraceae bacterium]|nr:MerR family transcriptional regulator [Oscillospiraceae bacterium]